MHFVGQRGREDMCITNSPCIRGKGIVAAPGLADSDARETGRNHGAVEAAVEDAEDDVVGIDVLVNANVVSIGSMGLFRYVEEVISKTTGSGCGVDAEKSNGVGIEPGCGNNVQQSFLAGGSEVGDAGERSSGQGIGGWTTGGSAVVKGIAYVASWSAGQSSDGIDAARSDRARCSWVQNCAVRAHAAQSVRARAAVVLDIVLKIGKSAARHACGGDRAGGGNRDDGAGALVIEKEESAVPSVVEMWDENRSADGSSEKVLAIFRNGMAAVEEVIGVEGIVAEILPKIAMQAIRS